MQGTSWGIRLKACRFLSESLRVGMTGGDLRRPGVSSPDRPYPGSCNRPTIFDKNRSQRLSRSTLAASMVGVELDLGSWHVTGGDRHVLKPRGAAGLGRVHGVLGEDDRSL